MESIDDNEELEYTEDAFNVLQFSPQEKFDCYMLTAGVMSCGGIEFITKGRDDQAECEAIGEEEYQKKLSVTKHLLSGPDTFPGKVAHAFQVTKHTNDVLFTVVDWLFSSRLTRS